MASPTATQFGIAVIASGEAVKRLEVMRKSNLALRLQPSVLDEVRKLATAEGVALNQLINVAVAEGLGL